MELIGLLMNIIEKFVVSASVLVLTLSCSEIRKENAGTNAIWLWSTHMNEAPLQEWADKGIGHVLLNEAAFFKPDVQNAYNFAAECKKVGIKPHVWFQCYARDRKWNFPVDKETGTLKQEFFDDMVRRAENYVNAGFEGIHLDYIRFCGNADEFNFPETGLTAVGIVNECCRQMHDAVKAINPEVILSAALMPEIEFFAINFNRFTGMLPDWLLKHPKLDNWIPFSLVFPQEGKNRDGRNTGFYNEPVNMDYYYDIYQNKRYNPNKSAQK